MHSTEMVTAVLIPLGFFMLIFGIVYMYKRENLAMIEKGMNPKDKDRTYRPAPYTNLKWGQLLVGAGAGLLLAFLLNEYVLIHSDKYGVYRDHNPAIYFALIAIGGGVGLITSYRIEKKELLDKKQN